MHRESVFILGILRGGIFPQKILFPPKIPSYQAKVSYFCSEKLLASGGLGPPDPPNGGSAEE